MDRKFEDGIITEFGLTLKAHAADFVRKKKILILPYISKWPLYTRTDSGKIQSCLMAKLTICDIKTIMNHTLALNTLSYIKIMLRVSGSQ